MISPVACGRLLVSAVLAIIIFASFQLLQPDLFRVGLDPSWVAALREARLLNLRFGIDIIFTLGPLASVYDRAFAPSLFYEYLAVVLLFTSYLAAFFYVASVRARNALIPAIAIIPFLFTFSRDSIFISLPIYACLIATLPNGGLPQRFFVIAGAAATATATMAKFSVFPIAVVAFVLSDAISFAHKRLPISLAVYVVGLAVILWWTSPGASLWQFIKMSINVVAAYNDAAAITGPFAEVVLIGVTTLALLALIGATEFKCLRAGETTAIEAVPRVVIFTVFLFMCAKAGLVRHDNHALTAWSGAAFAGAIYCVFAWTVLRRREIGLLLLIMFVSAGGFYMRAGKPYHMTPGAWALEDLIVRYRELSLWPQFLESPDRWVANEENLQQAAMASVRAAQPLPKLNGTVDAIPSIQSGVVANGLRYRPRPVFQEYLSCSESLIEANRAFFRSSRAPDYVLMAPGSIDGRYPALTEGPLWPDLLARYAVQEISNGLDVLRRREKPLEVQLQTIGKKVAELGESVPLDTGPSAIFAKIDIRPNIVGAIVALLFKSAQIDIDVQYIVGDQARYRLIPGIAREGFFLSPTVETAEDYLALATGSSNMNPRKVKSFIVATNTLGRLLWKSHFTVTLSRLSDDALRRSTDRISLPPAYKNKTGLTAILYRNLPAGPGLRLVSEGLLAHAPKTLKVTTGGHTELNIAFGIQNGAWQGAGETNGVCFRVVAKDASAPIWERCLDPKARESDRGTQAVTIKVPAAAQELALETACRGDCAWDWSYWGRIDFR
jgi:hypothetical protein